MYWSINFLTEVKNLHKMLIMIIITELKESVELKREHIEELPWYYNYISPVQSTVRFQGKQ